MDRKGFEHETGCSVCGDEGFKSLQLFFERGKKKLSENAGCVYPIRKNTAINELKKESLFQFS
jgi:hypothetical protein